MTQVLNIFRKDTRRFWPEILVSAAITAALMWIGPYLWRGSMNDYAAQMLRELALLLDPLMVISWMLLISRVVHAEPLVGDRQFWITRPYEWKKLLAAKLLFVAAYVYAPFLAMECVLLARAGFAPAHWIAGLLLNLAMVSAVLVLPLLAAATVTSNFGKMALIAIGVLLGWVVLEVLVQVLIVLMPGGNPDRTVGSLLIFALALALCTAAVVVQYSARRTRVALLLLGGMLAAVVAVFLVAPDRLLVDREYAQSGGGMAAAFDAATYAHGRSTSEWGSGSSILIGTDVPVTVSGMGDGYAALFDDVKFTLKAANGAEWTSGWEHLSYPAEGGYADDQKQNPGTKDAQIQIKMPRQVYDRFSGMPVGLQMTLAVTEARISGVTEVPASAGEVNVPGFGYCEASGLPNSKRGGAGYIACRSPLRMPLTSMRVRDTYQPCPSDHRADVPEETRTVWSNWEGSSDRIATDLFLVPVAVRNEMFGNSFVTEKGVAMCPVRASLTFTQYAPVRRTERSLTVEGFQLQPQE